VAAWAYPAPFDIYNVHPADLDLFLRRSPTGEGYYPALDQDGAVVAFAVFGAEARVRGQEPLDGVLDVGLGVHPERMSQGVASELLDQVLALGRELFRPHAIRTAVAMFNERSMALCRKAGLRPTREFSGPSDRAFAELQVPLVTTESAR